MLVYLTLLATVRTQPKSRMLVFMGLYFFSWAGRDRTYNASQGPPHSHLFI